MKTINRLWSLMAVLALSLSFANCDSGSSDDDEAGGGGTTFTSADFGEVGGNNTFVSDFQMSDVDLLIDFAINCDLLDLEWIKYMSNGFKGDLLSGPGEYSDATDYFQIENDILANSEAYLDAIERLANDGIFDNTTTTRGLKDAAQTTGLWVLDLFTNVKKDNEDLKATLRDMGAFGDKQMQEDIFQSTESHGGYKDAHSFFVALNNGELVMASPQIMSDLDDQLGIITTNGSHTYEAWENSKQKLGIKDKYNRVVDRGKDLGNKAIKIEETALDAMTGGGYSTAQKVDKKIKDTQETLKKMFGGNPDKLTKEQVEEGLNKRGIDKLKSWIPKTGNDNADAIIKFASDKLGDMALQKDPTGEVAKKNGKTILDIKNNTDEKQKVIVVTGDDGKASVVIPDKDGNGTSVTDPGNKKITAVTKGGKRSTTATTAKKEGGKQEEKIAPESTGTPEIKASVSKLPFKATPKNNENVGTFTVTTNCKYFGVKIDGDAKWLNVKKDTKTGLVTVTVKANTDKEPRKAKLIIAGSNDKNTTVAKTEVTVTQEAASEGKLSVSRDFVEMDADGGNDRIIITSEGYEIVKAEVSENCMEWVKASIKTSSDGGDVLALTITKNESYLPRTGTVIVRAGNDSKLTDSNSETIEVTIQQAGIPIPELQFKLESQALLFPAKGGSKTVKIATNCNKVAATCDADWVDFEVGSASITITVKENKDTEDREANIYLVGSREVDLGTTGFTEKTETTIAITQEGAEDQYGNEILWGTWITKSGAEMRLTNKGSYYYSNNNSEKLVTVSGTYTVTDYKCQRIAGTDGYDIQGTLIDPDGVQWTITCYYSKDGSGHYKYLKYSIWLTNGNITRVFYKLE